MKKLPVIAAFTLCAFAPVMAWACEGYDATSASTTPPERIATAPAASKVPAAKVTKTQAPKALKEALASNTRETKAKSN